jgi:hypothetical protein
MEAFTGTPTEKDGYSLVFAARDNQNTIVVEDLPDNRRLAGAFGVSNVDHDIEGIE